MTCQSSKVTMGRPSLATLGLAVLLLAGSSARADESFQTPQEEPGQKIVQAAIELSRSASRAKQILGETEVGSISCDAFGFHCTCKGAFDCAWLAWACGASGGIQGFDGDCFFPSSVPGADSALRNFKASVGGPQEASCEGIFCSCSGPSDSDDCKKIKACIDDVSCLGNKCGCIGGHVD